MDLSAMMRFDRPRIVSGILATCVGVLFGNNAIAASTFTMRAVKVPIQFIDYQFAVKKDQRGVPVFDWKRFRQQPPKTVSAMWSAIELENEFIKVQIIPSMARIHSIVNQRTGNEQLWINPCAKPLGANNDTGFWMTWGGIERVMPRREHGTSHALEWSHQTLVDDDVRKTIRCSCIEPLTGMRHELNFSLFREKPFLETKIVIHNQSGQPNKFSHWSTAVLSPGRSDEVTPNTELILPADKFVPDDRDFNDWMQGLPMGTETSPLRWVKNWVSIGDLLTTKLRRPFYAVYSHESDEGIVHTFDLKESPTVDIWGWGFPVEAKRQREFTAATPSNGYIEFWNGNVKNFKDESLKTIAADETIRWTERTFCVEQLLRRQPKVRESIRQRVEMHHPRANE